ncbi:hypothetical protein IWZ01DRAFT_478773 [Phyllosticta capitalensis]
MSYPRNSIAASGQSDEPLLVSSPCSYGERSSLLTRPFQASDSSSSSSSSSGAPAGPVAPAAPAQIVRSPKPHARAPSTANMSQDEKLELLLANQGLEQRVKRLERKLKKAKEYKRKAKRYDKIEQVVWEIWARQGAQADAQFREGVEKIVVDDTKLKTEAPKKMTEKFKALFRSKETKET